MRSSAAARIESYPGLQQTLWNSSFQQALRLYADTECRFEHQPDKFAAARRELGLLDRYYLLLRILRRNDVLHPWIYARCREVEREPDGRLDLWARGHYKSSCISYAGSIQEILRDPEITIGIFSHTRPIAKGFLRQIKREFEVNETLKALYPEVLYANPESASPQWSEDSGIIVRRNGNPKEASIEAWGLVDGQPTAKHFQLRIYDDVVVRDSVTTPEQIAKTIEALDLSQNLGAGERGRAWYLGTRYSFVDAYQTLMDRGAVIPRIHPATHDGTLTGTPGLMSQQAWDRLKADTSESVIATQQLLNPLAGSQAMFQPAWLEEARREVRPASLNVYILGDPAGSRKRGSDNTAIAVVGVDPAGEKYLLDGVCHKLDLAGRWAELSRLYRRWRSGQGVLGIHIGYERYGMQADLEYFTEKMRQADQPSFPIRELAWPREGPGSKEDRVQRLVPDAKNGRLHLPPKATGEGETEAQRKVRAEGASYRIMKPIRLRDHEGNIYDLAQRFLEEATLFPFGGRDDLIDAVSRIFDMDCLDSQRVFAVAEAPIRIPAFPIPAHWRRICGLVFGTEGPLSAAWLAVDRDQDTVYVTDVYQSREHSIPIHAAALKARGAWVPVAWPEASPNDLLGPQLAKQYREQGVKTRPEGAKFPVDPRNPERSRVSVEAGVQAMLSRMQTGRLKVFAHLDLWFEAFRDCHREGGKVVLAGTELMSATRIALMDLRHAVLRQADKPLVAEMSVLDRTMGW